VITGFNTDIEYDGVVYHVQTEDKGVNSPLILSLVYAGGEILASKRSPYEDLIASGFSEEVLADRLKRQHRLICAAINAGRINDLKRMGARDAAARGSVSEAAETPPVEPSPVNADAETLAGADVTPAENLQGERQADEVASPVDKDRRGQETTSEEAKPSSEFKDSPYTVYDPRRASPLGELAPTEQGLVLSMIEEEEFRAGESFAIRILVQKQWQEKVKPVASAALSVKILGTTFRPKIYSAKTGRDGVAEIAVDIPSFTSGRAAILVRAAADGHSKEMRRVIKPAS
jgi:hypothetical protein